MELLWDYKAEREIKYKVRNLTSKASQEKLLMKPGSGYFKHTYSTCLWDRRDITFMIFYEPNHINKVKTLLVMFKGTGSRTQIGRNPAIPLFAFDMSENNVKTIGFWQKSDRKTKCFKLHQSYREKPGYREDLDMYKYVFKYEPIFGLNLHHRDVMFEYIVYDRDIETGKNIIYFTKESGKSAFKIELNDGDEKMISLLRKYVYFEEHSIDEYVGLSEDEMNNNVLAYYKTYGKNPRDEYEVRYSQRLHLRNRLQGKPQ